MYTIWCGIIFDVCVPMDKLVMALAIQLSCVACIVVLHHETANRPALLAVLDDFLPPKQDNKYIVLSICMLVCVHT